MHVLFHRPAQILYEFNLVKTENEEHVGVPLGKSTRGSGFPLRSCRCKTTAGYPTPIPHAKDSTAGNHPLFVLLKLPARIKRTTSLNFKNKHPQRENAFCSFQNNIRYLFFKTPAYT